MTIGEIDDIHWLLSGAARRWLAECAAQTETPALVRRLRGELGAARAALVLEQARLRLRAREKFAGADEMFFTEKSLQQATGQEVATCKAARFPAAAPLADLCCGIGGDLLSLAARGNAAGVERDEILALLAKANCQAAGHTAYVRKGDASDCDVAALVAWHIDPDRRAAGRRTTRVEQYEPPLDALERLLAANPNAAVKLAPATVAPERWRQQAELEWIGAGGECRQQVAWLGSLAGQPGARRATIVGRDGSVLRTLFAPQTAGHPPVAASLGRWVFEPHAAVLAAGLAAEIGEEHRLSAVAAGCAYLTGDAPLDDPALSAFEVHDLLPLDLKRLKRYLRERHIGRVEVKKRGVRLDPDQLRRRLHGSGDHRATLLIARIGGKVQAIVAHRLGVESPARPASAKGESGCKKSTRRGS